MKFPFFSIIIPTLNEEKFLPKLLTCLLKQTYTDFEVVVVDGNSKDKTQEKARSFINKLHFLTVESVSKHNVSYQRNYGAEKARGEYLVFLDADTKIPPNYLSKIHEIIKKKRSLFLTTELDPDSKEVYDKVIMQSANLIFEIGNLIGQPFAVGANSIIWKPLFFYIGGFDEMVTHAEDYEFTKKIKEAGVSLVTLKTPKLTFSFRRYRREGRLSVLAKHARATIHVLTQGAITRDLFSYPMGGGQYVRLKKTSLPLTQETIQFLEKQFRKTLKLLEFF